MMNKKILLPFALSTLALFLHGCGGEKTNINEDPTKGIKGVTSNTSCDTTADDCLSFVLDYPIAGLNFDCSSDKVNHYATKLTSNVVTGACKLGDSVSFYIQGENARKISLGTVKLDDISKLKLATPPRIRLIDLAAGLTGKAPVSLNMNDETVRVAMAIVKIFQSIGVEGNNLIGDLQPTELSDEKKNQLNTISKDVGVTELSSGEYAEILRPWLNVSQVSDQQSLDMLTQLLYLANTGVWTADLPVYKSGGETSSTTTQTVRPDGFFGCNRDTTADCIKTTTNLLHSMGTFFLLTDRQGYTIGYGEQWRGPATITNNLVLVPYVLTTKVKPVKMQVNAQNTWFNLLNQSVNADQPLRFSLTDNSVEDLLITQGKLINGNTIPGTEALYRQTISAKETDTVDTKNLGLWKQSIGGENYKGTIDIFKVNPSSYLAKDIFKTEANVKTQQQYIFPLYATLTFKFTDATVTPKEVNLGIVIDEHGDIRTDIRKDATSTDMSGVCATVKSINTDGTITDSNDQIQYRVGTTGATLFSTNDKSITIRMILSNPKFGMVNGAMFGLNVSTGTGAKINIHNLLAGQATGINLTDFSNNTVSWSNTEAYYQAVYNKIYDGLENDTERNNYVKPTDAERELAKRFSGTVSIKIAEQNIAACKSIRTKL